MGFLRKIFGFRWSLYFVQNEKQIIYALHGNSVMRLVGYVMSYFSDGGKPVEPWSLYLNFNHTHKTIKLGSEHFTSDGEDITSTLIQEINSIDPGWQVKGAEPIFVEAATRKRIKISEHTPGNVDIRKMLERINKPPEVTFFSVMDDVFGTR